MRQEVVFEPPDTVLIRLKGEWLPEEASRVYDELDRLIQSNDKMKALIDVRDLANILPKAREIAAKRSRQYRIDKVAVLGASARVRMLGSLMLKIIPQIKRSKFFDTEAQARAWLTKEKQEEE
jgi:hypothetical protein